MASHDPFPSIVTGYPKLAAKMQVQPEIAIFRRFGALNAQNLLYFQAQLVDLEGQLREQQTHDHTIGQGQKHLYASTWFRLADSEVDGDTDQLDLVVKIRDVLRDYSKTFLRVDTGWRVLTQHISCLDSTIYDHKDA